MHRLIEDHLEEVLENSSLPAGPVSAHLAECTECRREVDAMRLQNEMLRSFALTGDIPEVEPRPGFYARVLDRIEAQRPVSIWDLFTESVFGRRLATASLAVAMLTGAMVIAGESSYAPQGNSVMQNTAMQNAVTIKLDPLYPSGRFAPELMAANAAAANKSAVLMNLVSYQGQ